MTEPELPGAAQEIAAFLERMVGGPLDFGVRAWDGSAVEGGSESVLVLRDARAVSRMLWRPGQLGAARAFVAGDCDIEGDLVGVVRQLGSVLGVPWPELASAGLAALRPALSWKIFGLPVPAPSAEVRRSRGARAVRHHYDVGDEFYQLVLGPSMVYSCAYWPERGEQPGYSLEEAQRAKLDLICRKLDLQPGMRLLDIGCGWGSLLLHAAQHYGVEGVGVTLARNQARFAAQRIEKAGLTDRLQVRLQDYRSVQDGPFDAVSSIEMTHHLSRSGQREHAAALARLVAPGGRVLSHELCVLRSGRKLMRSPFLLRYPHPDLQPGTVGRSALLAERSGLELLDVENLRDHFVPTCQAWLGNLERHRERATALVGEETVAIWRLFFAVGLLAFEAGLASVQHLVCTRPRPVGRHIFAPQPIEYRRPEPGAVPAV
ncbi:SAM-dependent methyltransferase [Streptomyces lavendofoliae]|uniref:Cyclopropane-fatty-acyl-phospholipid synthase n=1 Tax=Streptomyces lavendofoliae TaxID=67314 RepID=A0A918M7X5_9ACTN|nr:cyclopropane-fatty-acyl-phospholipid synthase family protein [Streptomyces lavendofoliae]GGU63416.1 cyclopropane-fatty-acyl-phospholipid synthase [Streptomyces lavendofoliae]